ncbi:hypothetical protein [Kutzneria kofuensis]|uniref:hypothetical protein n=1 Tax=Kutzneria kofuensis TaxID=103725 RepID=UPI0031E9815C
MDQTQPVDQTQPAVELPRRPRVLPGLAVLRRGDHEVQIGIDPGMACCWTACPRTSSRCCRR